MKIPLVSIIIPSYDTAHLIGETLDSVLSQTYTNWECIVVDDGSTDGTNEILEKYCDNDSRFQYYHRPNNTPKGANACRNFGIMKLQGDYVIFMDADDLLGNDCLNSRIKYFLKDFKLDVVVGTTQRFKKTVADTDCIVNVDPNIISSQNYLLYFLSHNFPWTIMSPMWDVNIIKQFRFNEDMDRLQDVDFHIRILLSKKLKIKRSNNPDSFYRLPETKKQNIAGFNYLVLKSFLIFFETNFDTIIIDKTQREVFKLFLFKRGISNLLYNLSAPYAIEQKVKFLERKLNDSNFFSYKERLLLQINKYIYMLKLDKVKGIGIHRILKYIGNYFNSLSFKL